MPSGQGAQPFPGMTLSSGGTTATISGASTTVSGEPGFSKKPIRLTPRQVVNRAERKLKALSIAPEAKGSGQTTLSALQKKYEAAVV